MGKIIVLTGGKNGCGKTTLTAALGNALAGLGKTVCAVDACLGRRGLDLPLGLQDQVVYDLCDLADGACTMEQALLSAGREGLFLVSAPAEAAEERPLKPLCKAAERLAKRFDFVLIDAPNTQSEVTLALCGAADEAVLITVPGDEAARATEQAAALLRERTQAPVSLVMNRHDARLPGISLPAPDALAAWLDLPLLGVVSRSEAVYVASFTHPVPVYPEKIRRQIEALARRLCGESVPLSIEKARRFPWRS